jgi:hypothetical protein
VGNSRRRKCLQHPSRRIAFRLKVASAADMSSRTTGCHSGRCQCDRVKHTKMIRQRFFARSSVLSSTTRASYRVGRTPQASGFNLRPTTSGFRLDIDFSLQNTHLWKKPVAHPRRSRIQSPIHDSRSWTADVPEKTVMPQHLSPLTIPAPVQTAS